MRLSFPTCSSYRSQKVYFGGAGSGIQKSQYWIPAFAGMTALKFTNYQHN